MDGDAEVRPDGAGLQRPGRRHGHLRPAEPELLRQARGAVQDHRPVRQPDERHLGRAGADDQRRRQQQLRRPVPEHRQALAAHEVPVDPCELRRHERRHRVLARRSVVGGGGTAGSRHRVRRERRHEDRPVRQARHRRRGGERPVRLVPGSRRTAAGRSPRTRPRRGRPTRSIRPSRTATAAGTSHRSRSRSTRPTTTAARASTTPSTASRATRSGPRTRARSPSTTRAATRSSTARSTRRATPRARGRSAVKVDSTAPTTTAKLNGEAPASSYDGPVAVDLDATDGDGSGVRATQIRVDGGEWQPYVEEETILNSAGRPAEVGAGRARRAQLDDR